MMHHFNLINPNPRLYYTLKWGNVFAEAADWHSSNSAWANHSVPHHNWNQIANLVQPAPIIIGPLAEVHIQFPDLGAFNQKTSIDSQPASRIASNGANRKEFSNAHH